MVIALTAPELVEKLVVVDVAPTRTPGTKETEDLVQALRSLDLSSLRNRREADALIRSRIPVSIEQLQCIICHSNSDHFGVVFVRLCIAIAQRYNWISFCIHISLEVIN